MRSKPKGAKYRNLTEPDLDEIERMMDHTGHPSASKEYRSLVLPPRFRGPSGSRAPDANFLFSLWIHAKKGPVDI